MPKAIMIRDRFTLKIINAVAGQRFGSGRRSWSKTASQIINEHISQTQPNLITELSANRQKQHSA